MTLHEIAYSDYEQHSEIDGIKRLCRALIERGFRDVRIVHRLSKFDKEELENWFWPEKETNEAFSLLWCCELLYEDGAHRMMANFQKKAKEILCGRKATTMKKKNARIYQF